MENSNEKIIMVTGGTGYIASWIIKLLLQRGFTVRTTVRAKSDSSKNEYLFSLLKKYPKKFSIFNADLLQENSFKEAMDGCDTVIHTASPFMINKISDPEKQLINPALAGTRNVLKTVNETESVKKVILTSSVVAIYGEAKEIEKTNGKVFTEEHWNSTSSLNQSPYSYSKTLAEKEAWQIYEKQNRWQLAVINPGFVLGPSLTKRIDSASIEFMISLANGTYKTGAAELYWGIADVRDVAEAHILAATNSEAKGRHIIVAKTLSMLQVANILREKFGDDYPFPKKQIPKLLLYFVGPFFGLNWKYISENVGTPLLFDNSLSKEQLGLKYRDLEETIFDHFSQLFKDGLI